MRRWVAATAALTLLLTGCNSAEPEAVPDTATVADVTTTTATPIVATTSAPALTTTSAPTRPVTLEGYGKALMGIQLDEGRYMVEATAEGIDGGVFSVVLSTETCHEIIALEMFTRTAANQATVTVGNGILECRPGVADLEIDTPGRWTVTVTKR